MNEDFLHYIWKFQLFDHNELKTTEGESLQIKNAGIHNLDSGPDFFNAQLKIEQTLWAGNVEIHSKASDWYLHNHQEDVAYDRIILHVVYEDDKEIFRSNGLKIPTLVLKDRIDLKLMNNYRDLIENLLWVPCVNHIKEVPSFLKLHWLDRMLAERLESKSQKILNWLSLNKNNWEETFYQALARNFGFRINAVPFELLATSLPFSQLSKHKDHLFQLEALLFGQAGLLSNQKFKDQYPQKLQAEYLFLKNKFKLKNIEAHLWKFMRMRPANFPSIRLSQFAHLLHNSKNIFSESMEETKIENLRKKYRLQASDYWNDHYRFDKKSSDSRLKKMSENSSNNILINTVAPFLFLYGRKSGDESYVNRSFELLEECSAENNQIIRYWKKLQMPVESSYHSQALIQLKNEYCDNKKCLNCAIGNEIIKS